MNRSRSSGRLLASVFAAAMLCAGCAGIAQPPTATVQPPVTLSPSPAPSRTVAPAQAIKASVEVAVQATRAAQSAAATLAAPTPTRPATPTPRVLVFAQPIPFRHESSGIAGLMPSGWILEGDVGGVRIRPNSGGPGSLTASLTATAQLPAGGPAALVSDLFGQLKRPDVRVLAETRTPDGGGTLTFAADPQSLITYVRAVLTERGLMVVTLSVTAEQLRSEESTISAVFDSVELSGDHLSSAVCLWSLDSRPLTAEDVYVIDFNNPGPDFAPPIWYSGGVSFAASGIGDFNGDGRQDLALVAESPDHETDQLYVLSQESGGTLAAPTCFNLKGSGYTLAAGDLSGDGLADVVASGPDQTAYVFLGAAEGIFSTRRAYPSGPNPPDIAVGDLNGDGRADVVLSRWAEPLVDLLLQQADGELAPMLSLSAEGTTNADLAVGDLNGDGLLDLVKGFHDRDFALNVFLQQPDHSLGEVVIYANPGNLWPNSIAVGDVTGDGRDDLVVSSINGGLDEWVVVFEQGNDGRLAETARYPILTDATATGVADIDGDGRQDVILAGTIGVHVLPQQADGRLGPAQIYLTVRTSPRPQSMSVGDLNGDGRLDIVTVGQGCSLLYGRAP